MKSQNENQYLKQGSPLKLSINLGLLNAIIRDIFLEQDYQPGEAIAKGLVINGNTSSLKAVGTTWRGHQFSWEELIKYDEGFKTLVTAIQFGYIATNVGIDRLRAWHKTQQKPVNDKYIIMGYSLLRNDPWGDRFVDLIYLSELEFHRDQEFYVAGLKEARDLYHRYTTILRVLRIDTLRQTHYSLPQGIIPRENFANISPKSPTRLQKDLQKLATKPSCSGMMGFWLRHPRQFVKGLVLMPKLVAGVFGSRGRGVPGGDEILEIFGKFKNLSGSNYQVTQLVSGDYSELNLLNNLIENREFPDDQDSINFERSINQLAILINNSKDQKTRGKAWNLWEKIIARKECHDQFALWAALNLAAGDYLEEQFQLSKDDRYIRGSRWFYQAPLTDCGKWLNDPGTRFICALRIVNVLASWGDHLKIDYSEYIELFLNVLLVAMRTNERMFRNTPFEDSKFHIQDRVTGLIQTFLSLIMIMQQDQGESAAMWGYYGLLVSEAAKSRIMQSEIALADMAVLDNNLFDLHEEERKLLSRQKEIRARRLSDQFDIQNARQDEKEETEYHELQLLLEKIWTKMSSQSAQYSEYVDIRRDENDFPDFSDQELVSLRSLPPDTALVSLYLSNDRLYQIVLHPQKDYPLVLCAPLNKEEFSQYIDSFFHEVVIRDDLSNDHDWLWSGEMLFSNLMPLLGDVKRICFIPHGVLHRLPLHALHVAGNPIIEKWEVFYAPSFHILRSILLRDRKAGIALVMGDLDNTNASFRKSILDEVDAVSTTLSLTGNILSMPLTIENIRGYAQDAQIIHIASHGGFDDQDALGSYIQTASGKFTARDWLKLNSGANLITLSACETGQSDILRGDELFGLSKALFFSGASSVITTLWEVSGASTSEWMKIFYAKAYSNNRPMDKVTAFREATLYLMKHENERYRNPCAWAAFSLNGNPK